MEQSSKIYEAEERSMLTVTLLLVIAAGVTLIGHVAKGWPIAIPVGLLIVVHLLSVLPR